jgi:hypothetical protein
MNANPHDHDGQPGHVCVLHFKPAYHRARHYIGWAREVDARLAVQDLAAVRARPAGRRDRADPAARRTGSGTRR